MKPLVRNVLLMMMTMMMLLLLLLLSLLLKLRALHTIRSIGDEMELVQAPKKGVGGHGSCIEATVLLCIFGLWQQGADVIDERPVTSPVRDNP